MKGFSKHFVRDLEMFFKKIEKLFVEDLDEDFKFC